MMSKQKMSSEEYHEKLYEKAVELSSAYQMEITKGFFQKKAVEIAKEIVRIQREYGVRS